MDVVTTYLAAARGFVDQVRRIPADRFDGPGLGEWDLRALVGHTSRSLATVVTYLDAPAEQVDLDGPEAYYRMAAEVAAAEGAGVLERGRRAGADLGDDPAVALDALMAEVQQKLRGTHDPLIAVLGGAGMRLSAYLPTRIFELTVHGYDIADATGLQFTPLPDALRMSAALGTGIAVATGHGEVVLRALTGRAPLPQPFSVTA